MFKKLSLMASLLLLSGIAYGANFGATLSVQIVPSVTAVGIPCGTDATIQSAIDGNPAGTTFNLAASCTYHFSHAVTPKNNDQFIGAGASSTILDEGGTNGADGRGTAFSDGTGVTIASMTIQNFGPKVRGDGSSGNAMILPGDGWTIRDSVIQNAGSYGIYIVGNGIAIVNNLIIHNGLAGISGNAGPMPDPSRPTVMRGNEISFNNDQFNDTCNGGGALKILGQGAFQYLNNFVHDNYGSGFWFDTATGVIILVKGNTFIKNGHHSVELEDATGSIEVANNVSIDEGNGSNDPAFFCGGSDRWQSYPAHMLHGVHNSVIVHDNFVMVENGPSNPGGVYPGAGLYFNDAEGRAGDLNNITMLNNTYTFRTTSAGPFDASFGTNGNSNPSVPKSGTSANNDHFHVPGGSTSDVHFAWQPQQSCGAYCAAPLVSFSQFQSTDGQESGGSIDTTDVSVLGCQQSWPGASGVGICANGSGWPQ